MFLWIPLGAVFEFGYVEKTTERVWLKYSDVFRIRYSLPNQLMHTTPSGGIHTHKFYSFDARR